MFNLKKLFRNNNKSKKSGGDGHGDDKNDELYGFPISRARTFSDSTIARRKVNSFRHIYNVGNVGNYMNLSYNNPTKTTIMAATPTTPIKPPRRNTSLSTTTTTTTNTNNDGFKNANNEFSFNNSNSDGEQQRNRAFSERKSSTPIPIQKHRRRNAVPTIEIPKPPLRNHWILPKQQQQQPQQHKLPNIDELYGKINKPLPPKPLKSEMTLLNINNGGGDNKTEIVEDICNVDDDVKRFSDFTYWELDDEKKIDDKDDVDDDDADDDYCYYDFDDYAEIDEDEQRRRYKSDEEVSKVIEQNIKSSRREKSCSLDTLVNFKTSPAIKPSLQKSSSSTTTSSTIATRTYETKKYPSSDFNTLDLISEIHYKDRRRRQQQRPSPSKYFNDKTYVIKRYTVKPSLPQLPSTTTTTPPPPLLPKEYRLIVQPKDPFKTILNTTIKCPDCIIIQPLELFGFCVKCSDYRCKRCIVNNGICKGCHHVQHRVLVMYHDDDSRFRIKTICRKDFFRNLIL